MRVPYNFRLFVEFNLHSELETCFPLEQRWCCGILLAMARWNDLRKMVAVSGNDFEFHLTNKQNRMKILPFFLSLIFISCQLSATNYYVRSDGGTGIGTSDKTAWSYAYFLTRAQKLSPGDSVFFRNSDVFPVTGQLNAQSNVYYGTYGKGEKARLTGFQTFTSWNSEGNGVFSAPLGYDVDFLMFDGVQRGKGRYPKATYAFNTYDGAGKNADGTGYIIDSKLSSSPSWAGATAVVRCDGQQWNRKEVVSQSGTQLTFSTSENWQKGNGYFFTNHPNVLTSAFGAVVGDWRYDDAARRIYMYFGNDNPNKHDVSIPLATAIINIPSKTGVTIDGLCVEGGSTGVSISNSCTNVTVKNCEVRYNNTGIGASGASDRCNILDNYVHHSPQKGIAGPITPTNYLIQGNRVVNSGMIIGAGASGPSSYSAIYFEGGTGFTVRRNYIDSVGFIGIRCFRGKDVLVEENVIKNFGFTKDDNGAIYAWAADKDSSYARFTNRIVRRNIIVNGRTEGANGVAGSPKRENGLYLDSRSHHILFDGNIVDNVNGFGCIILAGCQDITATNNIFFRTARPGFIFATYKPTQPMRDINVHHNIAYSTGDAPALELRSPAEDYSQFGSYHDNYYRSTNPAAFRTTGKNGGVKTLAQFQAAYGLEKNSTWQMDDGTGLTLLYNEHTTDTTINLQGRQYINLKTGEAVPNRITLSPFTGVVLQTKSRR